MVGTKLVARGALVLAIATALPFVARAEDYATSATADGTTISAGGGGTFMSLPDIRFTQFSDAVTGVTFGKEKNNDFSEYGGVFSGAIETPLWSGWTGIVTGFFGSAENEFTANCVPGGLAACTFTNIIATVGPNKFAGVGGLVTRTNRDVDNWGVMSGLKFSSGPTLPGFGLFRFSNVAWGGGADVRGLDQDIDIGSRDTVGRGFGYSEELDTTYAGGYLSLSGEYNLALFGVGGLWGKLGLRSFFTAHAGLYYAKADYDGRFTPIGVPDAATRLSLSENDAAVIAGLKLETRKQLGPRASISLFSEYEYYSWVPEMRYNDSDGAATGFDRRTLVGDDDAFVSRTTLRLNIGLGPTQLYAQSMK